MDRQHHSFNKKWVIFSTVVVDMKVTEIFIKFFCWAPEFESCLCVFPDNQLKFYTYTLLSKGQCGFGWADLPCLRCRLSTKPRVVPTASTWSPHWCKDMSWTSRWSCGGSGIHATPCCATVPQWLSYWDWAWAAWASSPPPQVCPGSGGSGWAPPSAS